MVFLCETKLSGREMQTVLAKFEMYYGMHVDSVGRAGGLAFWWHKDIKCEFLSASVHHMDFIVREASGDWRVTGFYGDYNEILFANEMKGGQRAQWQMNQFREAVDACGLIDVSFEGYAFTWDNGQVGEDNRQSRIDRATGTNEWMEHFPYARLCHLGREWSDHSPLKLVLDRRENVAQTARRFRFEQIWVGAEGCEEAILRGFERGGDDLVEALQESARELQAWKRVSIGKIVKMIATKRSQITRLNEGGRTAEEVRRRRKLVREVADLCRQEEQFWRQRSRALWLKDGDRNTSVFHKQAGQRKAKNHISKLVDDGGVVRCGDEAVSRVATSYFT
ncbi:uncharacterized protein LOC141649785 [Silene latifolia]|uniref:uncharacterized protein LOC141649785 n=1 Tax=Silene latifolia TaxID=37657 RepID=UPI003D778D9C